ncbi:MAG: sulfatase-like hydrolase/transferase [Candidatus Aminicenantes bacterium]|nr:sulfatase-like hydrolase/transferase [Candidatus Aminicenantes bacterium]
MSRKGRNEAAAIILSLFLAGILTSCGPAAKIPRPDHIIIITLDAVRPDHLGCYGYSRGISPNIDRLAQQGVAFLNAYANAPWTKPSVASLFSSLYPNIHRTVDRDHSLPDQVRTMAERLKESGYFTCFFNGGNPLIHEFRFDQGFDFYAYEESLDSAEVVRKLQSFLPQAQGKNIFAYIHLMDTHLPYHLHEGNRELAAQAPRNFVPGQFERRDVREPTARGELTAEEKAYLVALYDEQIRYSDKTVGELTALLQTAGILDHSLLILTSDHGEELWDHENYEHGHSLYEEVLRVPLIMVNEHLPAVRLESRVRLIDILPSIMELVRPGFDRDDLAGESVWRYLKKDDGKRPVFAAGTIHGDEKFCLIKDDWKVILNTNDLTTNRPLIGFRAEDAVELYDLKSDPGERHNLRDGKSGEIAGLLKELASLINTESPIQARKEILDQKTVERLKSLGYLQ